MKVLISAVLIIIISVSLIGCSREAGIQKTEEELRAEIRAEMEAEAQKNKDEETIQDTAEDKSTSNNSDTKAVTNNDSEEETLVQTETKNDTYNNAVNIKDLKVGSSFDGKEVTSVNYVSDLDFNFTLDGEYSFEGGLSYSDFEEAFIFTPVADQTFRTKIIAGGTTFDLPKAFMFQLNDVNKNIIGVSIYDQLISDPNLEVDSTITLHDFGFYYHDPQISNCGGTLIKVFTDGLPYPMNESNGDSSDESALIEWDGTASGNNYYKYKANTTVYFDLDNDGTDEEILYEGKRGKLTVTGYEPIEFDPFSAETEHFIIIKYTDKYDLEMYMIGLFDYGPSADPVTTLYSIVAPTGEKSLVSVGRVEGEIVPPAVYNEDSMDDFNYKAVLLEGQGIFAPVRLAITQTWYGRSLFTYYTTYVRLVDNCKQYGHDYITKSELDVVNSVTAYEEKDKNSKSVTIKAGQRVTLFATDNKGWIAMEAEDGTSGWVVAKDVTMDNFSGLAFYD